MHPKSGPTITPNTEATHKPPNNPDKIRDRIALRWFRFSSRVNTGVMTGYLGTIALIGIEGLAIVLSFSSMWPVGIPLIAGTLGLIYFSRERLISIRTRLRGQDQTGEPPSMDAEGQP